MYICRFSLLHVPSYICTYVCTYIIYSCFLFYIHNHNLLDATEEYLYHYKDLGIGCWWTLPFHSNNIWFQNVSASIVSAAVCLLKMVCYRLTITLCNRSTPYKTIITTHKNCVPRCNSLFRFQFRTPMDFLDTVIRVPNAFALLSLLRNYVPALALVQITRFG